MGISYFYTFAAGIYEYGYFDIVLLFWHFDTSCSLEIITEDALWIGSTCTGALNFCSGSY